MYEDRGSTPPRVADWYAPTPRSPVTGTRKILVIRIDFSDRAGIQTQSYYNSLVFGTSQGQMKHYFTEVSCGQLNIVGTVTANWYRSAHTMVYWGSDTDTASGQIDDLNEYIFGLAREAVELANSDVDFKSYDTDNDNVLDPEELSVCIVHAGIGQEYSGVSTDIWSHRWYIYGQGYGFSDTSVDGVRVSKHPDDYVGGYFMQAEASPMGTFAHEFGHDLGLPDLYDTDYSSEGVGDWDLMASGSWLGPSRDGTSPAHPSAWCKYMLGWITPTTITATTIGTTVNRIETSTAQSLYKLPIATGSDIEYFLIENRQQTGYDRYLPGSGVLIWHIDERQLNIMQNDDENHKLVDLEEADGLNHLDSSLTGNTGDATDPWYSNLAGFTGTSNPNSNSYSGATTGIKVKNISPSSSTMTVDFEANQGLTEIAYDDGYPEEGWAWTASGCMFAVRFTPSASGQLKTASFCISYEPATFRVRVLDASRSNLISPIVSTPTYVGWFDVDLSTQNIMITAGVDFYICMESTVAHMPHLGDDQSNPDGRSWDWDGSSWALYAEGDYLIRARVQPSLPSGPSTPFFHPHTEFWFTWYDLAGATIDNIHFVNPTGSTASVSVTIGSASSPLATDSFTIAAGASAYKNYPGVVGGPVHITSNQPIWATQRIVGWNSFKEVFGLPGDMASTEIYYTWYDMASASASWDAIHFLNPSATSTAHVNVYIGGALKTVTPITIDPGGAAYVTYPSVIGGPVRILSDVPIFSTQRVVGWSDFDEVVGLPSWCVYTEHWFNWYDSVGASWDAIHFINLQASAATINVYIAGNQVESFTLNAGQATWKTYSGVSNGPVRVVSTVPIRVTQRIVGWGGFKELYSVPTELMSATWYFNWYDTAATQSDKIYLSNPSQTTTATINIYIHSILKGTVTLNPGQATSVSYPSVSDGPVLIQSNISIMTSQRIVGWSSFEETLGVQWT